MYRDIKAIGEQGVPLSFEPNRGYFIMQGYFLPPVSFTSEEANALLLMEYLVRGFADKSIHTHYSTALNKVKSVLRGSQKRDPGRTPPQHQTQLLSSLNHDFLSTCRSCNRRSQTAASSAWTTKNMNEETSTRHAEPVGLVF